MFMDWLDCHMGEADVKATMDAGVNFVHAKLADNSCLCLPDDHIVWEYAHSDFVGIRFSFLMHRRPAGLKGLHDLALQLPQAKASLASDALKAAYAFSSTAPGLDEELRENGTATPTGGNANPGTPPPLPPPAAAPEGAKEVEATDADANAETL